MKALTQELDLNTASRGVAFSIPLEHIAGIDMSQVSQFQEHLKDAL